MLKGRCGCWHVSSTDFLARSSNIVLRLVTVDEMGAVIVMNIHNIKQSIYH